MKHYVLKQALIEEIEAAVREVLDEAGRQAEILIRDARLQIEVNGQEARLQLEGDLAIRRRRALAQADRELHREWLQSRKEAVDLTFVAAEEHLAIPPDTGGGRTGELWCHLVASAATLVGSAKMRAIIGADTGQLSERLKRELQMEVRIDPQLQGVILEDPTGRLQLDLTPGALLSQLRAGREAEIEAQLFEENHEA